jgi:tetratricopeptide (TPR) repeat protein
MQKKVFFVWYILVFSLIIPVRAPADDNAEADYAQAALQEENDAGVYYDRGNMHNNKGEYEAAIADYNQAIAIDPNLSYAYCNRGNAYYRKGNADQAIADYTKAIGIDPRYTLAYTNRGTMYYNRGAYEAAIADYTMAINIDPNDANAKQGIERVRQAREPMAPPERIVSQGSMSREKMAAFLLKNNKALEKRRDWVNNLIDYYITEAEREGVNYEIAFAQMCYHTNYLKFEKTLAKAGMNNFCGINSLASDKKAHTFESVQIGVRAHIQHLKGYASGEPLNGTCVDPRYQNIGNKYGFGSAAAIDGLSGKWAGAGYAREIRRILAAMYFD